MEETVKVGRLYREQFINNIREGVENNKNTFLVSLSSLKSGQIDDIRKELSKIGARVYVSKNRLAKLALKDLNQEKLGEGVEGQTAFVWSNEDSVTISKALMDFVAKIETFHVKGGILDGELLEKADVKRLSDLPSKEILQSQLLAVIVAPVTRLAQVLNGKSRDLLSILKQLSEKKEGGK